MQFKRNKLVKCFNNSRQTLSLIPDPPIENPNILKDALPPPPDSVLDDSSTAVSEPLSVDLLYSDSLDHALVNPYVLLCVLVKLTPEIYTCQNSGGGVCWVLMGC